MKPTEHPHTHIRITELLENTSIGELLPFEGKGKIEIMTEYHQRWMKDRSLSPATLLDQGHIDDFWSFAANCLWQDLRVLVLSADDCRINDNEELSNRDSQHAIETYGV